MHQSENFFQKSRVMRLSVIVVMIMMVAATFVLAGLDQQTPAQFENNNMLSNSDLASASVSAVKDEEMRQP